MRNSIRDVVSGERITAALANQGNAVIRSVRTIFGSDGVNVTQTEENGTTIGLDLPNKYLDSFIVQLVNKGPNGEADFTDARYWGQLTYLKGSNPNDTITISPDTPPQIGDSPGNQTYVRPPIIVCTSLSEYSADSHSIAVDGSVYVKVYGIKDRGSTQNQTLGQISKHYVFDHGGSIGSGQYQYQSFMMVSQNATGWEFIMAHPLL